MEDVILCTVYAVLGEMMVENVLEWKIFNFGFKLGTRWATRSKMCPNKNNISLDNN